MTAEQKAAERQELLEALQRRARVLNMEVTAGMSGLDYYYFVWDMPEHGVQDGAGLLLQVIEKHAGPVIRLFLIAETKPRLTGAV